MKYYSEIIKTNTEYFRKLVDKFIADGGKATYEIRGREICVKFEALDDYQTFINKYATKENNHE